MNAARLPSRFQRRSSLRMSLVCGLMLGVAALLPAHASAHNTGPFAHGSNHGHVNQGGHGNNGRHDRGYGRVIDLRPVYSYVVVREPRQECRSNGYRNNHSAAGPVVGSIVGGVIGNALANTRGNSRTQRPGHTSRRGNNGTLGATVAGAIIGAAIGSEVTHANSRHRPQGNGRHCVEVVESHRQRRFDHYEVTYVYQGRRYKTTRRQDPGHRIEVRRGDRPHRR